VEKTSSEGLGPEGEGGRTTSDRVEAGLHPQKSKRKVGKLALHCRGRRKAKECYQARGVFQNHELEIRKGNRLGMIRRKYAPLRKGKHAFLLARMGKGSKKRNICPSPK